MTSASKITDYRSRYGLQHRALAHTEHQALKGPQITNVKPFKLKNQRSYLYKKKRETRNTYEPYQHTTTAEHQFHFPIACRRQFVLKLNVAKYCILEDTGINQRTHF